MVWNKVIFHQAGKFAGMKLTKGGKMKQATASVTRSLQIRLAQTKERQETQDCWADGVLTSFK